MDVLFLPQEEDIYPIGFINDYKIDLDGLDQVMEGQFRPGHFKGVAMVVERLFSIVNPNIAFFGQKDFQQVCIIKHMVNEKKLSVQISTIETVRNEKGLALSSRNQRLSEKQKNESLVIYKTLCLAKKLVKQKQNVSIIKQELIEFFNRGKLKLEYLEIIDNETLESPENFHSNCTCCIAAYCGDVRLIDNMALD